MTQAPPRRPPQTFAPGGRRALDAQWLAYAAATGDVGALGPAQSDAVAEGAAQFNEGRFHASHETWEERWVDAAYPERLFLLALAKLAAGFAHAQRRNARGVNGQLADALRILRAFAPAYAGLDTARLAEDVGEWAADRARVNDFGPPYPTIERAAREAQCASARS